MKQYFVFLIIFSIYQKTYSSELNHFDSYCNALRKHDLEELKRITTTANINDQNNPRRHTPLQLAIHFVFPDGVEHILSLKPNLYLKNIDSETVFDILKQRSSTHSKNREYQRMVVALYAHTSQHSQRSD